MKPSQIAILIYRGSPYVFAINAPLPAKRIPNIDPTATVIHNNAESCCFPSSLNWITAGPIPISLKKETKVTRTEITAITPKSAGVKSRANNAVTASCITILLYLPTKLTITLLRSVLFTFDIALFLVTRQSAFTRTLTAYQSSDSRCQVRSSPRVHTDSGRRKSTAI